MAAAQVRQMTRLYNRLYVGLGAPGWDLHVSD